MKTKKTQEQIAKELFNMVYQWGRVGLKVDHIAPAYTKTVEDLIHAPEQKKCKCGGHEGTPCLNHDKVCNCGKKYNENYDNNTD